jgi:hypothetical protein
LLAVRDEEPEMEDGSTEIHIEPGKPIARTTSEDGRFRVSPGNVMCERCAEIIAVPRGEFESRDEHGRVTMFLDGAVIHECDA